MKTLIERLKEIPEEEQWETLVEKIRKEGEEDRTVPLEQFLNARES